MNKENNIIGAFECCGSKMVIVKMKNATHVMSLNEWKRVYGHLNPGRWKNAAQPERGIMSKFNVGDECWILESGRPRHVTITKINSNFAVVRFDNGGGIRVSISRLKSQNEVVESIPDTEKRNNKSPYQYGLH